MARGWESKSVESQIEAAEERELRARKAEINLSQIALERERESIELSKKRVLDDLTTAENPKYREMLQRSLEFLEEKLTKLGPQ